MRLWSEFDPIDRDIELAKLGITICDLINDGYDVPELKPILERLRSEQAQARVVLKHFGDQGHPQPRDRTPPLLMMGDGPVYGDRTPDWGRLSRLDDDEAALAPAALSARPRLPNESQLNSYTHASLEKAVKSFDRDRTRGDVERGARLPPQDARRIRLMHAERLLRLNAGGKLVVDQRVARRGAKYVLRYLQAGGSRWLDPNVELRGR